nr:inner membrane CreD family protein [Bacteroidota bacterium]
MNTLIDIFNRLSSSISLKLGVIGLLILILLIPAGMIRQLIEERQLTRDEVVREISDKWGKIQALTGPVLVLPYFEYESKKDEVITIGKRLHILPESLDVNGNISPEIRYRGIYKVIVYESHLDISGSFRIPDLNQIGIPAENVDWKNASVVMGLTDMRGIQHDIKITWQGEKIPVNPGITNKVIARSGFTAKVPISNVGKTMAFNLNMDLNGSQGLYFTPVGKTTNVKLLSG